MLAIAGAKGGCGKTTVTLGLAQAFAREGVSTLAVDADRQLPNMHVLADVDRTPTLAAIEEGTNVRAIAQQHPSSPTVGVLPAPRGSEQVDLEAALDALTVDDGQVLLDCPSGAGPDVVEPMTAADSVIVVTTDTDRSLRAAETTIELARRLDVPVQGVVLNECSSCPDVVSGWNRVPTLGCVPRRKPPLLNDDVQTAFDEVVETLRNQSTADRRPPEYDDGLVPTGIETLDRRLGGGLPPGSVVALTADAASQAEQLLYRTTAVRGTLYLSTGRSKRSVDRAIETSTVETGRPTVRYVGGEDALQRATEMIAKLPEGANLVLDTADSLERRERGAYRSFLDELTHRMVESDGIAILYCLKRGSPPENRVETMHAADVVFDLRTVSPDAAADVEHYLSVPKFRAESGFAETIPLEFDEPAEPV